MWEVIQHIVDNFQFGAIKGTCTIYALIMMVHDWLKATDRSRDKNFIWIVLLDYMYVKAFDHIDTNTLLRKLENINIPDEMLRWVVISNEEKAKS